MNEHTCHARDCETPVPRHLFMCKPHWFRLPRRMRDAVWAEYTPGQESDMSLVTDEYLRVTRDAIDWLASPGTVSS